VIGGPPPTLTAAPLERDNPYDPAPEAPAAADGLELKTE
jgi:hypothetical protein